MLENGMILSLKNIDGEYFEDDNYQENMLIIKFLYSTKNFISSKHFSVTINDNVSIPCESKINP